MSKNIPSAIKDNCFRGKLVDFLSEKIKPASKLSFVSAYFTIYAYKKLKDKLDNIDHLNFLFGEPRFLQTLDPNKTESKAFIIRDKNLSLGNTLQQNAIAKACADWIIHKVDIKSIKKEEKLIHGKMYHIDNDGLEDAIVGSSNFTLAGLGVSHNSNIELNLEVNDRRDRTDLKNWFYDEVWNSDDLVEDVKDEVLEYLERLYRDNNPEFIYYKTLFHIFEKFLFEHDERIEFSDRIQFDDTVIWDALFEFQKDGVKSAINKIKKHNGCIIADSVGLGKTFEALAIIKYFELIGYNVLVLCPKKLMENWTVYTNRDYKEEFNPFLEDKFNYTVLAHTDLSREKGMSNGKDLAKLDWGNYDLVVIDESHNFRNTGRDKVDDFGEIIKRSRYNKLLHDVLVTKREIKTKVLLLSATPVNTSLKDLRNQIRFITANDDRAFFDSIGIVSLHELLKNAQKTFTHWAKESKIKGRNTSDLISKLNPAFFKLLDEITIARSRKHIQKYYEESIKRLGGFPDRNKNIARAPKIDLKDRFMTYDKLNDEISNYKLSLYNPFKYVKDDYKQYYEEKSIRVNIRQFTQAEREHYLIGMMKVNFLKRLESSIESFEISMERTIEKIEKLEEKIRDFQNNKLQNLDIDLEELQFDEIDEEDEELQDVFIGKKLKYNLAHLNLDKWLKDLANDKAQLNILYLSAKDVTQERDAKLAELKELIKNKVTNPTINKLGKENKKVLVFTAFTDTAYYLYDALQDWALNELNVHIAVVSGGTSGNKTTLGRTNFNDILTNFSPISKHRKQKASFEKITSLPRNEIDILIATDCISEGQNLQDCDFLINYDIHWNPVRIIQRFGRIDRIGSINTNVQLVNFWPTPDLNKYIDLKNRVEARMALVDLSATSEDNILEVKDLIEDELTYRDQQLMRLKDEVLDLEDLTDNISLSDFSLDDFRMELIKYIESNKKILQDAPLGLYAVVPEHDEHAHIKEGVIFCLKQKGNTQGNTKVNPLHPYFLVYITTDGIVKANFTSPKHVLDIYRALCLGKTNPYEELCRLFDTETQNGENMERYTNLLLKATKAIKDAFSKKVKSNLISSRFATLTDQKEQIKDSSDFVLVSWLIIK
jgi:ERCC4-related helicase